VRTLSTIHRYTENIHIIGHVPQERATFHRIAACEWSERDETSAMVQKDIYKNRGKVFATCIQILLIPYIHADMLTLAATERMQ
jgi:hypothetical protein